MELVKKFVATLPHWYMRERVILCHQGLADISDDIDAMVYICLKQMQ
jgi:hypothetical protein